jgi:hypothetical protein
VARQRFERRLAQLHKCGVLKRVLKSHGMINTKSFAEAYFRIRAKVAVSEWFGLYSIVEDSG